MTATKRRPRAPRRARQPRQRKPIYGLAFGAWFMANVRREIAAGRVRETITANGEAATIHLHSREHGEPHARIGIFKPVERKHNRQASSVPDWRGAKAHDHQDTRRALERLGDRMGELRERP
jgi:hypothetical protein